MKRTTHASFSDETRTIDVKVPTSWAEMSQDELLLAYKALASGSPRADLLFFMRHARAKVLRWEDGAALCRFRCNAGGKTRLVRCRVTPEQLAELLEPLAFLSDPGRVPVRLDQWHGARAVNAELHGVSFGNYLRLENLYQGFLASGDEEAVAAMASILYPGIKPRHIDKVFVVNVLQWMVQVKGLFTDLFRDFFKPAGEAGEEPTMLEVMNSEIRALTGGDVTKEEIILDIDCWRALTELDFKAKEMEEMKRITKS